MPAARVLLLALVLLGSTASSSGAAERPAFTEAPCGRATATPVTCGFVTVPETRGGARTITVAAAVAGDPATLATRPPVLLLGGGPGTPLIDGFLTTVDAPALRAATRERAWIAVDARGVGRSMPGLTCPAGAVSPGALRRCARDLQARGIDLNAYDSARNADDVEALRLALGVRQWNLYGISYGSRVALEVARSHPGSVRSIVHDSALTPSQDIEVGDAAGAVAAFELVLSRCAADRGCRRAFPSLRSRLVRALRGLRRAPVRIAGQRIDDVAAAGIIRGALFDAHTPELAPKLMDAVARARTGGLRGLLAGAGDEPTQGQEDAGGDFLGEYLSVNCREELPFDDPRALARFRRSGTLARALGVTIAPLCAVWPVRRSPRDAARDPRVSAPQLVLTGEYDASGSPRSGRKIMRTYPGTRTVLFRGAAHTQIAGPLAACAIGLARRFAADPAARASTACARRTVRFAR